MADTDTPTGRYRVLTAGVSVERKDPNGKAVTRLHRRGAVIELTASEVTKFTATDPPSVEDAGDADLTDVHRVDEQAQPAAANEGPPARRGPGRPSNAERAAAAEAAEDGSDGSGGDAPAAAKPRSSRAKN